MKIYTKTGDSGHTGLICGKRVSKSHLRIQAYGTVDELNSWLGLLGDLEPDGPHRQTLIRVQRNLFVLGALLAAEPREGKKSRTPLPNLEEGDTELLEREIDRMNADLPAMTHFILPGGHPSVSYCHIARTVCRRAERHIIALHEMHPLDALILTYINRLSDYLFVLARTFSRMLGKNEIKWIPEDKS